MRVLLIEAQCAEGEIKVQHPDGTESNVLPAGVGEGDTVLMAIDVDSGKILGWEPPEEAGDDILRAEIKLLLEQGEVDPVHTELFFRYVKSCDAAAELMEVCRADPNARAVLEALTNARLESALAFVRLDDADNA